MNNLQASQNYTDQIGVTATPEELLLLLLNAEIKNVRIAILCIEAGKVPEAHEKLTKAQSIIDELICSLNWSYEISKELASIYTFIKKELVLANVKKDAEKLKKLLPIITDMRDTWEKAYKMTRTRIGESR